MKRGFTLLEFIFVAMSLAILAAILFPAFAPRDEPDHRWSQCQTNLKNIGLGFAQYLQDSNDTFPAVTNGTKNPAGWTDALLPYVKSNQVFACPAAKRPAGVALSCEARHFDFWMNAGLARRERAAVEGPANTLLAGDGDDVAGVTGAHYGINSFPAAWLGNLDGPLYRHLRYGETAGANYGFADYHVKWLPVRDLASPSQIGDYTFMPK